MKYVVYVDIRFGPEADAAIERAFARVAAGEGYDRKKLAREVEEGLIIECQTVLGPPPSSPRPRVIIGDPTNSIVIKDRRLPS